jgi:hypothetical protein
MPQLLVNKTVSIGPRFLPLASDNDEVQALLRQASGLKLSGMRTLFGPERLEPRGAGLPALRFWSFTAPTAGPARPRSLLRLSFADDAAEVAWDYQGDERPALVLAGLVAARMLRR